MRRNQSKAGWVGGAFDYGVGEELAPSEKSRKTQRKALLALFALFVTLCGGLTFYGAAALTLGHNRAVGHVDPFYTVTPRDMRRCHSPDYDPTSLLSSPSP